MAKVRHANQPSSRHICSDDYELSDRIVFDNGYRQGSEDNAEHAIAARFLIDSVLTPRTMAHTLPLP
jgi:hypothetical protein